MRASIVAMFLTTRKRVLAAELVNAIHNIKRLREALDAYVKAQGRMLDKWSEGDKAVKKQLWQNLHKCEEAGRAAKGQKRHWQNL